MFAASSRKLSMSPGTGKLLNTSYLPNKVEDPILQWRATKIDKKQRKPAIRKEPITHHFVI